MNKETYRIHVENILQCARTNMLSKPPKNKEEEKYQVEVHEVLLCLTEESRKQQYRLPEKNE